MVWNWQRPEWPNFFWARERFARAEKVYAAESGVFVGSAKHLTDDDRDQLLIEALSSEAVTTSAIEGEVLDRASVQSSLRRGFGLAADPRQPKPGERGIAEMMLDLHRGFALPLAEATLFNWHRMIMAGDDRLGEAGAYRRHDDPMRIVSGPLHAPRVHFEAPPSRAVPNEMAAFLAWFNRTAPDGRSPLPTLTRAAIAHLYFESIHPFEDGNGRVGRALAEKALAQGLGRPTLTALAATILTRRKDYYEALERSDTEIEITDWVAWFAATAIEAQRRALALADFIIAKTRLLDKVSASLNARQTRALLRVLREGPEGFLGGLSAGNYVTITGATAASASRDLADLVAKGAMLRSGERRYARYRANVPLRPTLQVVIGEGGQVEEIGP